MGEGGGEGGESCQGLVVQGGSIQGKIFGVKRPGEIALEGVSWASIVQGVIVEDGNYSGVIIQRAKIRRVIFLGKIL